MYIHTYTYIHVYTYIYMYIYIHIAKLMPHTHTQLQVSLAHLMSSSKLRCRGVFCADSKIWKRRGGDRWLQGGLVINGY